MERVSNGLARFRNPEYTGENRCLPCSLANLVIALVLAFVVGIGASRAGITGLGVVIAGVVFLLGTGSIYVRGYLVPGTPTLTKRYVPPWVLAAFGKEDHARGIYGQSNVETDEDLDVEHVLLEAGVLTEDPAREDLRLAGEFRRTLQDRIDDIDAESTSHDRLFDLLDAAPGDVEVEERATAFRVSYDGTRVGTWESRLAFLTDVTAAEVLSDRIDDWDGTTVRQRGQLLNGLRLFLETCPGCGGDLTFGVDTVESCCSTRDVAAVTCEDCEARLFESTAIA